MPREYRDLNSKWKFGFIPAEALTEADRAAEQSVPEHLVLREVRLPHDFQIEHPGVAQMPQGRQQGYFDRFGMAWYRREFEFWPEAEYTYVFCCGGMSERATISLNGILLGRSNYAYTPVRLDMTKALRPGHNELVIRVDCTAVPADRWYTGAGLYRSAALHILPKQHLDALRVKVDVGVEGMTGKVTLAVESLPEGCQLSLSCEDVRVQGAQTLLLKLPDIRRWSPDKPQLYDVQLDLLDPSGREVDTLLYRIGFRELVFDKDKGLFLNGEAIKLQGVCLHQDFSLFGTAVSPELWRKKLLALKQLGCNTLRLAHHLYDDCVLDLCDELGFMVYEEAFDKWTGGAYGRYYAESWERDLTYMVRRDRHRPSIIIWGVGNEVEKQAFPSMLALLRRHVAAVKALDTTRPVTLALNPHFQYPDESIDMSQIKDIQHFVDENHAESILSVEEKVSQIAKIAAEVDLLACNYQEQWYEAVREAVPDKLILGSESYIYFRGEGATHANYTERCPWLDVLAHDYVIGAILWTGIDYLGEAEDFSARGWSGSLLATDLEARALAEQYRYYWQNRPPFVSFQVVDYAMPEHSTKEHWDSPPFYKHWEFPEIHHRVIPYRVITNCESVEAEIGERQFSLPLPQAGVISGYLPYFAGSIKLSGRIDGRKCAEEILLTPGKAVALGFDVERYEIRLKSGVDIEGDRLIRPMMEVLKVRVLDSEGRAILKYKGEVHFKLEGPAEIAGVDNADLSSHYDYRQNKVSLAEGRACVGICILGEGELSVTASAKGLRSAVLKLRATIGD